MESKKPDIPTVRVKSASISRPGQIPTKDTATTKEDHSLSKSSSNLGPQPLSLANRRTHHPSLYLGSYASSKASLASGASGGSRSPRASLSHAQLAPLLPPSEENLDDFGLAETREGFFDATFCRPNRRKSAAELRAQARQALPPEHLQPHPLSGRGLVQRQKQEVLTFWHNLRTRKGIRLLKSFLGVWIAYVICLITASRSWLGPYHYILVVSSLINHAGRPIGSQIDGAISTIMGAVCGLGWGSLALYVSTSTGPAQKGYGGVLVTFMIFFVAAIGWLRCAFPRFYQFVISAGIAICYACLADTGVRVSWHKMFDYGVPFVLGQALCLSVCILVLPTAGARNFSTALHDCLALLEKAMEFPHQDHSIKPALTVHLVALSTAVRDYTIDFTVTRIPPSKAPILRNHIQAVVRSLMLVNPETMLFEVPQESGRLALVQQVLSPSTQRLLNVSKSAISSIDSLICKLGGLSSSSAPAWSQIWTELRAASSDFDNAEDKLYRNPVLNISCAKDINVLETILFAQSIRHLADQVILLSQYASTLKPSWTINAPCYPWRKAIMRANAQVRHDRGGLTAAFYFSSRDQLERSIADLSRPQTCSTESSLRHQSWALLHRLQGFETRFALKVALIIALLSVPAWLPQSRGWWNTYSIWWSVVAAWLMMHPRVGGSLADLLVRCFCAILGAIWASLAVKINNSFVMAIFAAVYLFPMVYRFSQSPHSRSGLVGCLAFIVVSLDGATGWTLGTAFVVGISGAVGVNWILWPFVARHELRKSLSSMILHSAVLYRNVIGRYVYHLDGEAPAKEDMEKSELLEARMREGFVRLWQLLELTRHEIRLRAPFEPLPYAALITSCEAFFEHLVQVRQSSLFFRPRLQKVPQEIGARRDAVAVILLNLYNLACSLRAARPVPRYLPDAALARHKLLFKLDQTNEEGENVGNDRIRADVYHFAFSRALTDIVDNLQGLIDFTKEICGETRWS